MWINPTYAPHDALGTAKALVDAHPLAVVITEDPLAIAHMPILWRETAGGDPVLIGHMPLADPTSKQLAAGGRVTIVFPGPASYITPNWYHSEGLPTYNYAPVHVAGVATRLGEAELREHLLDLVADHEAGHSLDERAWALDGDAHARLERLLPRVLGFSVPVTELQVKTKLGQNRDAADNATVASQLAAGDSADREISSMMRGQCPHTPS
ncbi:FMN-binding negative transcriptional regulator [Leucobacter albus]|uniref:FMN-binding negative transcriptional regulator n=1 Tax=Leucobacter albus TaxID=272210 RepID=A0ABW3TP05_9MICO